jgi:hypothetical protein
MTSRLKVDAINSRRNADLNLLEGSAKAWINFNGTGTPAARDSFNVSTITDSGTGDYDINFSSNMSNDDYAPVGYSNNYNGQNNFYGEGRIALGSTYSGAAGQTTALVNFLSYVAGGTGVSDATENAMSVHGDLA